MPNENEIESPEPVAEPVVERASSLRYPELAPRHPLNIIDPDSDVDPREQVGRERREHAGRRAPRR